MARRGKNKGTPLNGWLILDKPEGLTSTQALGKARRILDARKVGHAGTLDPLATGVLPLAFGEATKTVPYMQDASKTYEFTVTWGAETNTDDCEGEITQTSDTRPKESDILQALSSFQGEIEQTPPQYSAIKIDGQRAYKLARAGEDVDIPPRKVFVYDLQVISLSMEEVTFTCTCSKGTYIRSIARDLGRKLECLGHISQLRRTAVGIFDENAAISLDELQEIVHSATPTEALLPVEAPLDDIPALFLTEPEASRLRHGQSIVLFSKDAQNRMNAAGLDAKREKNTVVLVRTDHKPVGLAEISGAEVKPVRILNV